MALPDFNSYKYIMFVDASGDDGYKFGKNRSDGSSFSFVVSCFVTEPKYLEYNNNILAEMKKTLFIKPEHEIKSTALKRHKNADAAYDVFSKLKGFAYSLVADKKLIKEVKPDGTNEYREITLIAQNDLSGITHVFPVVSLFDSELVTMQDKILIVIDNMKKREMESIKSILSDFDHNNYDLIFRDSKDKDFALIQIADILAGTIRDYYEESLPISSHNRYCGFCTRAAKNKNSNKIFAKCKDKKFRKNYLPYISNKKFNIVISIHLYTNPTSLFGEHFVILPVEQMLLFTYIQCLIAHQPIRVQ